MRPISNSGQGLWIHQDPVHWQVILPMSLRRSEEKQKLPGTCGSLFGLHIANGWRQLSLLQLYWGNWMLERRHLQPLFGWSLPRAWNQESLQCARVHCQWQSSPHNPDHCPKVLFPIWVVPAEVVKRPKGIFALQSCQHWAACCDGSGTDGKCWRITGSFHWLLNYWSLRMDHGEMPSEILERLTLALWLNPMCRSEVQDSERLRVIRLFLFTAVSQKR